ncbi:MAG: mechanosensitive ion channel family protein [Myxococcota bacterium]
MQDLLEKLPPWLTDGVLWGVPPLNLGMAFLVILLGFASRGVVVWLFGHYVRRLTGQTRVQWDDDLVRLVPTPLSWAAQIGFWYLAAQLLRLPEEPVTIKTYVFQGLQVALAVTLCWTVMRLVDVLALFLGRASAGTESRLDDQLVPLIRKSLKLIVVITFGVTIVQNLGYSVTSVLASLGVGGLALALAAQDTVANVFGSVVVFTDRPFQVGDWIEVGGIEGTVEEVGFRTTRVRRFDKSLVTLPNQTFSSSPITNHSSRPIRRIDMTVGLTYESTADQLEKVIEDFRELVKSLEGLHRGFSFVHLVNFGASSLDVRIYCFTESTVWTAYLGVQEKLMLEVMRVVQRNGLELAFPTRTVYLRDEKWKES